LDDPGVLVVRRWLAALFYQSSIIYKGHPGVALSVETNAYRRKAVEYISVPASNMENWASLRNMLARIYEKIDDRFLHEIVKRDLGNFSTFVKVVEKLGEK
jgi:hypothetical protein